MNTPTYRLFTKQNEIYIKREDLIPFSFGGNKARKAVNFFRDMEAGGFDCVVTYGSSSSNHGRIVANMAVARGLPCYIVSPTQASSPTYNSQMMALFGAQIETVPVSKVHDTIERRLQWLRDSGKRPYFIAGGGHGNLGTQAYVDCYTEIRAYERQEGIRFDYIFLASGTGTTQAGLICGRLMQGDTLKIVGISIARKNPTGRQVVLESVESYLAEHKIGISREDRENATIFVDEYTGDGYGKENPEIRHTIETMLTQYGIPMDSTYTAKAYTGMQKYITQNHISGKKILFIHTGGTPLFFNDFQDRQPNG